MGTALRRTAALRRPAGRDLRGRARDGARGRVARRPTGRDPGQWLVDLVAMTADRAAARRRGRTRRTATPPRSGRSASPTRGWSTRARPSTRASAPPGCCADDGSTVARSTCPPDSHIPDGSPADVAVDYDYAADSSDTCITSYRPARRRTWVAGRERVPGPAPSARRSSISPDGRWLLTDDLPAVWDLRGRRFAAVDIPRERRHGAGRRPGGRRSCGRPTTAS